MKGGVGRYTCNLFQALKKKGMDVNVAIGENKKIIDNSNNNLKIYNNAHIRNNSQSILENNKDRDCIYTGIIKKGDPKNSDRLLHLVNEIKPDIVNIQYEKRAI